jgi:hypothetical protein
MLPLFKKTSMTRLGFYILFTSAVMGLAGEYQQGGTAVSAEL